MLKFHEKQTADRSTGRWHYEKEVEKKLCPEKRGNKIANEGETQEIVVMLFWFGSLSIHFGCPNNQAIWKWFCLCNAQNSFSMGVVSFFSLLAYNIQTHSNISIRSTNVSIFLEPPLKLYFSTVIPTLSLSIQVSSKRPVFVADRYFPIFVGYIVSIQMSWPVDFRSHNSFHRQFI